MITADMVPDAPGIWLYHCHVSDHMLAGMVARYEVKPR
jgi:hephaestin